jgi:hypothetical protein
VAAGCVSGPQNPYANAVPGYKLYNLSNASSWEYTVIMSAGGANSTWNMTVNNSIDPGGQRNMTVGTVGNGMDILYDVWWNGTSYQVDRMTAKGSIGDYYQERNVSAQQILTLPDIGLQYYYVPLQYAGNVNVRDTTGKISQLYVYTATGNAGLTLTYWIHPAMPLPAKIQLSSQDMNITMYLVGWR